MSANFVPKHCDVFSKIVFHTVQQWSCHRWGYRPKTDSKEYRTTPSGTIRRTALGTNREKNSPGLVMLPQLFALDISSQETAPHILAALEAQRARVPQQQPPQQPRRTAIPGFVFDPERDRFFLSVKNPLGIPDRVRKTTPLSVGGTGVRGSNRRPADRSDSPAPVSGPAEGLPAAANRTNSAATRPARSWNTGGRGIHSFVMNRRKGFYGGYSPGAHCTFAGSSMGGKNLISWRLRFVCNKNKIGMTRVH